MKRRTRGASASAPRPAVENREIWSPTTFGLLLFLVLGASLIFPVVGLVVLVFFALAWLVRSGVCGVLATFVIVMMLVPSGFTVGPFAVSLAMGFGLLAALMWVASKALPNPAIARGSSPITVAVQAFFVVILVNYFVTHLSAMTQIESRGADRNLALLLALCGVALAATDAVRTRVWLYRLVALLVAGAAVVGAIAVLQYTQGWEIADSIRPPGFKEDSPVDYIYERAGRPRVAGTARHPIELGIVCAVVLPLALHLARFGRSRGARQVAVAAAVLIAVALPMAGSRSALGAVAAALLVLIPSWTFGRMARAVVGATVVVLIVSASAPGLLDTLDRIVRGQDVQGQLSSEAREDALARAYDIAGERPWFGQGFGTYSIIEKGDLPNLYGGSLVEIGRIGLAAFIGLLLVGVGTATTTRARTRDPALRDLAQSLLATVVGVAVGSWGLFSIKYTMVAGILFLALGLIGALARIAAAGPLPVRGQEAPALAVAA